MKKIILIIDDEAIQATALRKKLLENFNNAEIICASSENDIQDYIENKFYNLVLLDIRMDDYQFDGIKLAKQIIEINPFAKIIFVSKFLNEYMPALNELMGTGRILAFSEKEEYDTWIKKLTPIIQDYYNGYNIENEVSKALQNMYQEAKNEEDTYKKGVLFENFVTLLFRAIGYSTVLKRVKDISLNEIDLIVRNDIDDSFLSKFGRYFLIECKNKPNTKVDKNDYIIFRSKLQNSNDMANLGFIFTTSSITRNTYIEDARASHSEGKILFIDNNIIYRLTTVVDIKEEFKRIIDEHVKMN